MSKATKSEGLRKVSFLGILEMPDEGGDELEGADRFVSALYRNRCFSSEVDDEHEGCFGPTYGTTIVLSGNRVDRTA